MILKVRKIIKIPCRCYAKYRRTVLAADTFAGKIIPKTKNTFKEGLKWPTKHGGRHIITMLPGAAPGPKLMSYVKDVFKVTHVPIDFEEIHYDGPESESKTEEFGKLALTSMYRNSVGIKGNIVSPNFMISSNVALRQELDLYVCVVRVKSYPNVKCKYSNMDIYICRQNTEGEYAMLEHSTKPGIVESLKIITEENTSRFADWCFRFAIKEKRKKITIVHKANILKLSDGLFMKVVKEVGKSYPDIEVNDMTINNATMQLVENPSQFDMIVTPNLYGNILSNIACGLVGGAGLMSAKNFGPNHALFEAGSRHLTFLDADNLNPTAMLNASVDLLRHIGKHQHADIIDKAINKTLSVDKIHTHDIGGTHTSDEMVESVKSNIEELLKSSKLQLF